MKYLNMKVLGKSVLINALILLFILISEKYSDYDLYIQDLFYNNDTKSWIISRTLHKQYLTYVFYSGLKAVVIVLALALIIKLIKAFYNKQKGSVKLRLITALLSMTLITSSVSIGKMISNVYIPRQVQRYGGKYPYVRIIDPYPKDFVQVKRAKGFPAGHATTGFALLGLIFLYREKKSKTYVYALGMIAGWVAGIYQMLRGEHFLSHTLFTMFSSLIMLVIAFKIALLLVRKCRCLREA